LDNDLCLRRLGPKSLNALEVRSEKVV
jgi:hypothetical protein